ncbi:hypothetical protein C8R47DRAFT_1088113 [Mycena vitilis]|nr:hypothetical protein C8R47DRAFT_1088113 [Mycena vitilis]
MFFRSTLLFGAAVVLPSVMGLTLDTPVTTDADGTLEVTWKTVASDPAFTLLLKGPITIDIATGIAPATLKSSVGLGQIPPGKYTLEAVNADDIEEVLSKSKEFSIDAAGDPAGAPPPPPAKGTGGKTSTVTVTVTVTETPAATATKATPPGNAAPATVTVTVTETVTAGAGGAATAKAGKSASADDAKSTGAAKAAAKPAKAAAKAAAKPATASKPKQRMVYARATELHLD